MNVLTQEEVKAMFKIVSEETHGTYQTFLQRWLSTWEAFHKTNKSQFFVVSLGCMLHQIILEHMPFDMVFVWVSLRT